HRRSGPASPASAAEESSTNEGRITRMTQTATHAATRTTTLPVRRPARRLAALALAWALAGCVPSGLKP
ncbi:RND efflux system outer membrane lipoprotein, partial [Burkholderia pseudomallei 354a]